jgi:hypothetical protein
MYTHKHTHTHFYIQAEYYWFMIVNELYKEVQNERILFYVPEILFIFPNSKNNKKQNFVFSQ